MEKTTHDMREVRGMSRSKKSPKVVLVCSVQHVSEVPITVDELKALDCLLNGVAVPWLTPSMVHALSGKLGSILARVNE